MFHKFADGRETGVNLGRLSQMSLVDEAKGDGGPPKPEAGVKIVWTDGHADVLTGQLARKIYDFVTANTIELPEEDVTLVKGGAVVRGEAATTLMNLLKANAVPDDGDASSKPEPASNGSEGPAVIPTHAGALKIKNLIAEEAVAPTQPTEAEERQARYEASRRRHEERALQLRKEMGFTLMGYGEVMFILFADGMVPISQVRSLKRKEDVASVELLDGVNVNFKVRTDQA